MSNDVGFQIVCTNCGCLSIRIKEPQTASRDAIVYCGDCGVSRGTVGALRDLSVRQYSESVLSTDRRPTNERAVGKISKRYKELQRLRQQVEVAELIARESIRLPGANRARRNMTHRVSSAEKSVQ
jgi:hypothetical protein